jgi:hypothetical protein
VIFTERSGWQKHHMKTRLVVASFLVFLLIGCNQKWSQSEKDNAEHFIQSVQLVTQAHAIANKRGLGVMSSEDFDKIVALYKSALREANLVTDGVLAKANPALPNIYRSYFQKGLELRISSWENSKPIDEMQGSALVDSWGDWYAQNHRNIKIPR